MSDPDHQHERQQRALLDNIPDMAWLKDEQCRYLAVNTAYLRVLGLPEAEVLGKTPAEVWPADVATIYLRTDRAVLTTGQRSRYEETRPGPDGTPRWFETIKSPIRDESGQIVGTVGISRDISERKANEDALVRSRARLRALSHHLQTVREEERARIARELHDGLGQTLTAMKMDLASLRQQLPPDTEVLQPRLARLIGLVDHSITDLQRIASDLRPLMLDELGLVAATRWLVDTMAAQSGLAIALSFEPEESLRSPEVDTAAFRILQEALTNIVRHSGARRASVTLRQNADELCIDVSDDGHGLPLGAGTGQLGHGLLGMHERAGMLGGSVVIDLAPEGGTRIRAHLPLHGGGEATEGEVPR